MGKFTKPRFSENPHLVNKSLLTKHFTKWGFDCTLLKDERKMVHSCVEAHKKGHYKDQHMAVTVKCGWLGGLRHR